MDSLQLSFLESVSIGDTTKIKDMLRNGMVDVKYKHKINGWNALHWAARRNFASICKDLIFYGFDPAEQTGDGKIAYEILPSNASEELKKLLFVENYNIKKEEENMVIQEKETNFVPNYIKYPPFPHLNNNKTDNIDKNISTIPDLPSTPSIERKFSYGRRDSATKTRFLLVRTCCFNGKEAFKRVTLPGGASVEFLKITIEKAMKLGRVMEVITLPDHILVESDEQIKEFNDCQKVEVIFDDTSKRYSRQSSHSSNDDSTFSTISSSYSVSSSNNTIINKNTQLRKGNYTAAGDMNEVGEYINTQQEDLTSYDDKQITHEDSQLSDISSTSIQEKVEETMNDITTENGFIHEPPVSKDSITSFDIVTSDAVLEANQDDKTVIKKVSLKKDIPQVVGTIKDLDHGLKHIPSTPRHQFFAEHVEDHVSPKISFEKSQQEAKERQQLLITITTATAVALGGLCLFRYLFK
uniref:ANK_REP_REGION domain-containing protein n=1 Tax=Parastrongyloides trichosuri TaxID=131310 RepID=A0A0N4Z5T3_PARTI